MCNLDKVRIMLPAFEMFWNVDIVSDFSSQILVVRYAKFHVFAKSCRKGISNSCNDLINIQHVMRKYGSLQPHVVTIN